MRLNKADTVGNGGFIAGTFDNGGFVFGGDDFAAGTKDLHADFFEFHAFVAGNHSGVSENGDVFHDFFAAVTERGGFEDEGIENAFELVEHEDGESFAFDFFGDDDKVFATRLGALLKKW